MEQRSDELPGDAWREITVAEGSEGPRSYRFSAQRVRPTSKRKPGEIHWAIYRRNLDGSEPRYYLSNAPGGHSPGDAGLRGRFAGGALKRSSRRRRATWDWTSTRPAPGLGGITMWPCACWAGAFLLSLQQDWGGKDAPDHPSPQVYRVVREMLPRERFGPNELLRWLEETQECNERARRSHAKRRAALRASPHIPP